MLLSMSDLPDFLKIVLEAVYPAAIRRPIPSSLPLFSARLLFLYLSGAFEAPTIDSAIFFGPQLYNFAVVLQNVTEEKIQSFLLVLSSEKFILIF